MKCGNQRHLCTIKNIGFIKIYLKIKKYVRHSMMWGQCGNMVWSGKVKKEHLFPSNFIYDAHTHTLFLLHIQVNVTVLVFFLLYTAEQCTSQVFQLCELCVWDVRAVIDVASR